MTRAEHKRVAAAIEGAILEFCRNAVALGWHDFHMDELRAFVETKVSSVAPESPGRILRALRQRGLIDYVVTNRASSAYRIRAVAEKGQHA